MKISKYKLLITGLDAAQLGQKRLRELIESWVKNNGAKNISSGVVRCDADPYRDVMLYSVHFDSSHWTGIGFDGFDKKNPGTTVTKF